MRGVTNYSYLLELMFGTSRMSNKNIVNTIPVSSLSNKSVQAQLKAAGIDTNSKQYKIVAGDMMNALSGGGYTNVQAIKNRMSHYDKDGDYIDPITGLAGLVVNEKNIASKNRIINISESSREEMFELTKREFLQENGIANGDTTKRSDVYINLYRKTAKNDRLSARHTLEQYERAYTKAFVNAVKTINSNWKAGNVIPAGALDGITRKSVESMLVKNGSSLIYKSTDFYI